VNVLRVSRQWRALLALLLLVLLPSVAPAQTFPQFTGLVSDAANILPPDRKAALEAKLEALQKQTNHQLVVATIPDLQGYDIADYGYRLGRAWAVGLKGADNGLILIIAPKERKVRIEVGYGLEPIVTDALSSVIIQQQILPAFKAGDMPAGIEAGADALAQQLSLPDDQAKAKAAAAAAEWQQRGTNPVRRDHLAGDHRLHRPVAYRAAWRPALRARRRQQLAGVAVGGERARQHQS
jgi:uncharacterized protein